MGAGSRTPCRPLRSVIPHPLQAGVCSNDLMLPSSEIRASEEAQKS